jgi:hypothetical protein
VRHRAKQPAKTAAKVRPGHLLRFGPLQSSSHAVDSGRTRAGHETPALIAGPPAPVRPARHATGRRPASASTGVPALRLGALVLPQPGRSGVLPSAAAQAPTVGRGDAGSLTRCFAAPNPWTTDLPKPILAACVQGCSPPPRLSVRVAPRCASACAGSSPVCRCPVSQSVCRPASHSAGLIRPGGFAVSTVAATPLH